MQPLRNADERNADELGIVLYGDDGGEELLY
jgi:hypothetical protein